MRLEEISASIKRESWESQRRAGRYNPALVALFDNRRHVLPVGDSDYFTLYRVKGDDSGRVWCVSISTRFGYCGACSFLPDDTERDESAEVFCDTSQAITEVLGRADGIDELTERTIARRLIAHVEACCYG